MVMGYINIYSVFILYIILDLNANSCYCPWIDYIMQVQKNNKSWGELLYIYIYIYIKNAYPYVCLSQFYIKCILVKGYAGVYIKHAVPGHCSKIFN